MRTVANIAFLLLFGACSWYDAIDAELLARKCGGPGGNWPFECEAEATLTNAPSYYGKVLTEAELPSCELRRGDQVLFLGDGEERRFFITREGQKIAPPEGYLPLFVVCSDHPCETTARWHRFRCS